MPKLKIEYDNRSIEIEVPCEYRARTYKKFLIKALENFTVFLNDKLDEYAKPIVAEALFEVGFFETLASMLDNTVLDFLIIEIDNQQKQINWQKKYNTITADDSIKLLEEYFEKFIYDNEFLLKKYPKLDQLANTVTQNFIKNMKLCVNRVIRHNVELKEKFFKLDAKNNIKLVRIISSDSDLHQDGKQVLILEFKDDSDVPRKLVYKPSSVECDAWLVGNTELLKLKELGPSILEMLNSYLKFKLPTYLIYPFCSPQDGEAQKNYGFIEYLSHVPWPKYDLNKLAWEIAKTNSPSERQGINDQLQVQINKQFQKELGQFYQQQVESGSPCDFIIDEVNQSTIKHYSYQCGVLTALMYSLKVTDMHIQNLIVHNRLPYLIDLEFAFQPHVNSIEDIGCLDNDTGAMTNVATGQSRWRYLHDMSGLNSGTISLPEKNCLFMRTKTGKFLPCRLDKQALKNGFNEAIQIFHDHNDAFLSWLELPAIKKIKVRIIPFSTSSLRMEADILSALPTIEKTEKDLVDFKETEIQKWLDELLNINNDKSEIKYLFPRFAVLHSKHIETDYNAKSIPAFYIVITKKQLFDAHERLIEIDYEELKNHPDYQEDHDVILEALNLKGVQKDYFLKSPWEETFTWIKALANSDYLKIIKQQVNATIDVFIMSEQMSPNEEPLVPTQTATEPTQTATDSSSSISQLFRCNIL